MRAKNKLLLWSTVIFDELGSILLLVLLMILLTITVSFSFVTVRRYNRFKAAGELFSIRGSFFYRLSLDEGFISNKNDHKRMLDKINSLDSVKRAVGLNTNSYFMTIVSTPRMKDGVEDYPQEGDGVGVIGVTFVASDYSSDDIFPVITTDNRIIRKMNTDQIILDESARSVYSVGDKIWVDGIAVDYETGELEPRYAQVEIIGFISRNQLILNSGSGKRDLKSLYTTLHDLEGETETVEGVPFYFGLATGFAGKHDVYFSSLNDPQMLVITKNEEYSETEMLRQLEGIISNPDAVTPYSYYEEVYENEYYTEIKLSIIYTILASVLATVSLISFLKRWYDNRKEELIIYYVLGTTWRESILISLSPYIFSLVTGILTGALLWNAYSYRTEDYLNRIVPISFVMLFVVYLLLFIICALPYYLSNVKKNPIEIYKSREAD